MEFKIYINRESRNIQAISFIHEEHEVCASDIRDSYGSDLLTVHFRNNVDYSDFQDIMDNTVAKLNGEDGFNELVVVDLKNVELDYSPFQISAFVLSKEEVYNSFQTLPLTH